MFRDFLSESDKAELLAIRQPTPLTVGFPLYR
jgi:hypothetical protein